MMCTCDWWSGALCDDCEYYADHAVGGINTESLVEAFQFAYEIASAEEERVHLRVRGRGAAGQLMWNVYLTKRQKA